jgi:hypothetical protein
LNFTIRPKGSSSSGGFAITAVDAREALERVRELVERGLTEVQIFDAAGKPYDLVELERVTSEAERTSKGDRRKRRLSLRSTATCKASRSWWWPKAPCGSMTMPRSNKRVHDDIIDRRDALGLLGLAIGADEIFGSAVAQEFVQAETKTPTPMASAANIEPASDVNGDYQAVYQEGYAQAFLALGFFRRIPFCRCSPKPLTA